MLCVGVEYPRLPLTRELSAKLTEGLFYKMFGIIRSVMQIRNVSFTTPPSKIKDFCHLPRQREALVRYEIAQYTLHRNESGFQFLSLCQREA